MKFEGEKSPSFFVRLIVLYFCWRILHFLLGFPLARSVSFHLALLSFVSPRSPGKSKYPTHPFISSSTCSCFQKDRQAGKERQQLQHLKSGNIEGTPRKIKKSPPLEEKRYLKDIFE